MKVLILVDHAVGISGPHRNVVGSLNALGARNDVEVVLLAGMVDRSEPYAHAPNIAIRQGFALHSLKRILHNIWALQRAARDCDVIYVPTGLKSFLYAQTARVGRRLVAGPNVTPLPIHRADTPGWLELRFMCDLWFEASRMRRDHVRSVTGDMSVGYVHHAIDSSRFSPEHRDDLVRDGLAVPRSTIKVIFGGRDNEPRKGVSELLDAMSILAGQRTHLHLVLVGNMSDTTNERANALPNVTVLGFQIGDELARMYASADISVVLSRWKNFPFKVREAQASGLPVIAFRTAVIPEMVVHGEPGLLLDRTSGDAGAAPANAIQRLVEDPALRTRPGTAARQRVLDHFSERRLGNGLVAPFHG